MFCTLWYCTFWKVITLYTQSLILYILYALFCNWTGMSWGNRATQLSTLHFSTSTFNPSLHGFTSTLPFNPFTSTLPFMASLQPFPSWLHFNPSLQPFQPFSILLNPSLQPFQSSLQGLLCAILSNMITRDYYYYYYYLSVHEAYVNRPISYFMFENYCFLKL